MLMGTYASIYMHPQCVYTTFHGEIQQQKNYLNNTVQKCTHNSDVQYLRHVWCHTVHWKIRIKCKTFTYV